MFIQTTIPAEVIAVAPLAVARADVRVPVAVFDRDGRVRVMIEVDGEPGPFQSTFSPQLGVVL